MRIHVDQDRCEGHGECVRAAPEVFELADFADTVTVLMPEPPEELRAQVERAAAKCPVLAITIED